MKKEKTNVMRVLEQKKAQYTSHCYADTDAISGVEVASVLGQDPNQVFKTLVTEGNSKNNYVFLLPVPLTMTYSSQPLTLYRSPPLPLPKFFYCCPL